MQEEIFKNKLGARIYSEANDLKRTPDALADELNVDREKIANVIAGNCSLGEMYEIIRKMGENYPIDESDMYLINNDCLTGVSIMRAADSKRSSRIFTRRNKSGERTPYYEYRDSAMSKTSPFKPEWIKELRVVKDSDPENPDVAYNNGHFLHQLTFFIGPVNFYWERDGKKYCREMNTGDSNYITPFHSHSFSSRDKDQDALIIAVTFGGDVRRAQKELYALGNNLVEKSRLDFRNHPNGMRQLIMQHLKNERQSIDNVDKQLKSNGSSICLSSLLNNNDEIAYEDIKILAKILHVEPGDLMLPKYDSDEDVVVKHKKTDEDYFYPNDVNRLYTISPLAKTSKMPLMKGFDVEINTDKINMDNNFESSLHNFGYNYGDKPINISWEHDDSISEDILYPGDSIYIQPFVKHALSNSGSSLFFIGVSGTINLETQRELSYFPNSDRVAFETKKWFD